MSSTILVKWIMAINTMSLGENENNAKRNKTHMTLIHDFN
jgi:hypothetical protein